MEEQLRTLQQPAAMATHLAEEMQQRVAQDRVPEPPPPRAPNLSGLVSAPVSRDVPNSNGKRSRGTVTLSRDEVEAAKMAGIPVEEYARQKARLAEMKASGEYGGDQR